MPSSTPFRHGYLAQRRQRSRAVHRNFDVGVPTQIGETHILVRAHHLVGNQNIADASGGHHLRLAQLGARHADGARLQKFVRQRGDFDSLGVRSPRHVGRAQVSGHPLDVALQPLQVHPQHGRIQLVQP